MPTAATPPSNLLDVCRTLCFPPASSFPEFIPFIGRGNIWINDSLDQDTLYLAQTIMAKALMETSPGQLSLVGYDGSLTGIFAPFAQIAGGESHVLTVVSSVKDMTEQLEYASQHIQSVQNVIQGTQPGLLEFRDANKKAIESFLLFVIACDMDDLSVELFRRIQTLMRRGPQYGLSFLIISPIPDADPLKYLRPRAPLTTLLEPFDHRFRICTRTTGENPNVNYAPLSAAGIKKFCSTLLEQSQANSLPTVPFTAVNDCRSFWTHSSAEGITCRIGTYGLDALEITLGDEINQRHNALITGAVGQGKSNLIQVIIHSLCLRYSPQELNLYLLDFKEGVTFKAFAGSDEGDWLPHARALGLESDVSFGQAVLEHLHAEYKRRMRVLKEYRTTSINKLRREHREVIMSRIVVVIDEFQLMFGEDPDRAREIARLLERSVRLYRAAGIHFILASQSISGNVALATVQDSLFAQVPVRIALKNSIIESMNTLGVDNPQAAFLRPREAIVNLDYGALAQNKRSVIAYADESVLEGLRHEWWSKAQGGERPSIFKGDSRLNAGELLGKLELGAGASTPTALLGSTISVSGKPLGIPLPAEPGRNIKILGSPDADCDTATGMMQAAALSLALQLHGQNAAFLFYDAANRDGSYADAHPFFAQAMRQIGHPIRSIAGDDLDAALEGLAEQASGEPAYVFLSHMDSWRPQQPSTPYSTDPSVLDKLAQDGPLTHVHLIAWWQQSSSFDKAFSSFGGGASAFNTTVFLRASSRDVQQSVGALASWEPQENRALVFDPVTLSEPLVIIPCAPLTEDDLPRLSDAVVK